MNRRHHMFYVEIILSLPAGANTLWDAQNIHHRLMHLVSNSPKSCGFSLPLRCTFNLPSHELGCKPNQFYEFRVHSPTDRRDASREGNVGPPPASSKTPARSFPRKPLSSSHASSSAVNNSSPTWTTTSLASGRRSLPAAHSERSKLPGLFSHENCVAY